MAAQEAEANVLSVEHYLNNLRQQFVLAQADLDPVLADLGSRALNELDRLLVLQAAIEQRETELEDDTRLLLRLAAGQL